MNQQEKSCCTTKNDSNKGILSGVLFGLVPHIFCIAFILFSIIGSVVATAFLKKMLLVPYFFNLLILISLLLATISSVIYLKKDGCLCATDIKSKWKYIVTMYSMTISINLLMFFLVMQALANINSNTVKQENYLSSLSINVQIPCSGHAPLIIDELDKDSGVVFVRFKMPNTFEIKYDPEETSPEKIASLEIFKTYKITIP